MGKLVLVIVLGVIAVVLVAAVCGKSPVNLILGLIEKFKGGNTPPKFRGNVKNFGNTTTETTIIVPSLHMHQMSADGSSVYRHDIALRDFSDSEEKMIGIPVSHPGANCEGIKLYAEKNKLGQYNTKDKDTYNALTVNTGAITLGVDKTGFYGQVTNAKSIVYIINENKEKVQLSYGDQFEINDGTYILVNYQWLYFCFPDVPAMPGMFTPDVVTPDVQATNDVPTFVKGGKKNIGDRIIGARKPAPKAENKTVVAKNKVEPEQKVTRGFPLDEDNF